MNIKNDFIPLGRPNRPNRKIQVKKVCVHYVGNTGTTAQQNADYFKNVSPEVSSNFVVGLQGEIICTIPDGEMCYCASNNNANHIHIETCHPTSLGKFNDVTEQALAELVSFLVKKYSLDIDKDVVRHFDLTGKCCPNWYVNNPAEWVRLKARFKAAYDGSTPASVGDMVKVIGTNYATGQNIPAWVKSRAYKVAQVKPDRVLLSPINSWVLIKDIERV